MTSNKRILVVCTGNICRSPMGEQFLASKAHQAGLPLEVASAGIHALVGEPPDRHAQEVMAEVGEDISQLRGMQCNASNLLPADLILVMDRTHLQWLHKNFPPVRGRVMLMGKWSGDSEVPDPYGLAAGHFRMVRDQLDEYSQVWCDWLLKTGF